MKITNTAKRRRLSNMRDCLRQVQQLLPARADWPGDQFICNNIPKTNCSDQTRDDTRKLIYKSLGEHYTFNCWMSANNPNRRFSSVGIMKQRQKWIEILIRAINIEIDKLDDDRKNYLPSL